MNNTAKSLSAAQVVEEFKTAHNSLDLLRVFLVTGTADISRSHEFLSKLQRNTYATSEDKARYTKALKMLEEIELRRIELTHIVYNAGDVSIPITDSEIIKETETTSEEKSNVILMLPKLEDILERVRTMLVEGKDPVQANKEAFETLKTSVGQGKVVNAEGKPVTWDNDKINEYLAGIEEENKPAENIQPGDKVGFETIYNYFNDMIKNNAKEPEIKEALKLFLMGKVVGGKTAENDYLIKDETVFEDYYNRLIHNLVKIGIEAFENKDKSAPIADGTKEELVEKKLEEEVIPLLKQLDKDESETSFTGITKKIRDIYKSFNLKAELQDSLWKAKELAATVAPNLLARNKSKSTGNMPLTPVTEVKEESVQIYDESHNIKETNKALWAEVEKYQYLTELFDKAVDLSKKGNWKDALSMCIILISSGKIKETATSKDLLSWDVDQIKLWYHSNVEIAVSELSNKTETVNVEATVVEDKKEETPTEEKQQGPVPQAGSIEKSAKEQAARILKDAVKWKDKYSFKSFDVKTDHHRGGAISFEIVDATPEQEPELLITEVNMTKFFDEMRDRLIASRNDFPKVKAEVVNKLSEYYEISNSEAKRIVGNLQKEADELRKEVKSTPKVEETEKEEVNLPGPSTEVITTEAAPVEEVKDNPPVSQQETGSESENASEENVSSEPESATENTVIENSTSGNESKNPYEGFEKILKCNKKVDAHKAIHAKATEYPTIEEGVKAVFEMVNQARKDGRYKKAFIHNWKPTPSADLLEMVRKIVETGEEMAKKQ